MALRIFISYATTNSNATTAIWQRLKAGGHEVFYADKNLPPGAKIPQGLEQQIKLCDVFIVLWSTAAKASEWVSQEIGIAQGSGRVILPVILESGLLPPGFIKDRKYLPAYQGFQQALAFLDDSLSGYAQEKQRKETALMMLGLGALVLLAVSGKK
jgi:hypothetical protein